MGKMLGRGLDPLLDEWAALDYDPKLAPLVAELRETTELFKRCCDHLKDQERDVIDYFGEDLMDMAAWVVNGWLLLRDTLSLERKCDLARAYAAEHLPQARSAGAAILACEMTALAAKDSILA
jgi:hypothetical protein